MKYKTLLSQFLIAMQIHIEFWSCYCCQKAAEIPKSCASCNLFKRENIYIKSKYID